MSTQLEMLYVLFQVVFTQIYTHVKMYLIVVLVSFCCHNRLSQTWWLTAHIYSVTIKQAGGLQKSHWAKIKVWSGLGSFLKVLGENMFSCLFLFLDSTHILGSQPLPSSYKASNGVGGVFLTSHHSDVWFCLPLPLLRALVISWCPHG